MGGIVREAQACKIDRRGAVVIQLDQIREVVLMRHRRHVPGQDFIDEQARVIAIDDPGFGDRRVGFVLPDTGIILAHDINGISPIGEAVQLQGRSI